MKSSPRNPFVMIYREVALDYFHQMGGAGRYQGFQEWHPSLLTLGCALNATTEYNFDDLKLIWSRLPPEIVEGCDGLRVKVTQSFVKALQPFEARLECVRMGADLLLEELSSGSRGEPPSIEKKLLRKRVKLEFDLALSGI